MPPEIEDATEEQTDELVVEGQEEPEQPGEVAEEPQTDAAEQAEDEIVVSLGEEPAHEEEEKAAAPWVRDLRKANREKDRRIRELEQKLKTAPGQQPEALGAKPTLEGCDFDAEKFEAELEAWHNRKREADDRQRRQTEAETRQQEQWNARMQAVTTAGTALKVPDYDDAAQAFEDSFSPVQQGIIVGGPDDPKSAALLRYALGKNPKKAKELSAITDPIKFAFAVANLEKQLKVTPRKTAPAPESVVRSSVAGAAAVDSTLARLREAAAKSGDYTKVNEYKRAQRDKK